MTLHKNARHFWPEYGTLGRADIVTAAREARDLHLSAGCAFNYDAHSSEIEDADLPILKPMNLIYTW